MEISRTGVGEPKCDDDVVLCYPLSDDLVVFHRP
jgi:hypothetical protein